MPEKTVTGASPVAAATASKPQTITQWQVFEKAKLTPVSLRCDSYVIQGQNRHDASCHSNLLPKVDAIKNHMAAEHGNKFRLILRLSDGPGAKLWTDLAESGIEASDFRCEVCDEKLRFHPASIQRHLRPHQGKVRQAYAELARSNPKAVGFFCVTLGSEQPEDLLEDADEFASN